MNYSTLIIGYLTTLTSQIKYNSNSAHIYIVFCSPQFTGYIYIYILHAHVSIKPSHVKCLVSLSIVKAILTGLETRKTHPELKRHKGVFHVSSMAHKGPPITGYVAPT